MALPDGYFYPKVFLKCTRPESRLNKVRCQVDAVIYNGKIDGSTNSVSVSFFYREIGSQTETESATHLNLTNSRTGSVTLTEVFDPLKEYFIYCVATDKGGSTTSGNEVVKKAYPVMLLTNDHLSLYGDLHMLGAVDAVLTSAKLAELVGIQVQIMTATCSTPSNAAWDVFLTWDEPFPDANYWVGITRKGIPNGYDKVSYSVKTQTATQCTIRGWNDYSSTVDQDLLIIGVHLG